MFAILADGRFEDIASGPSDGHYACRSLLVFVCQRVRGPVDLRACDRMQSDLWTFA
jgi:hypothetical protein